MSDTLSLSARDALLRVAAQSIAHVLVGASAGLPDPATFREELRVPRASFVTLRRDGVLLGCMGSLTADEALARGVARHARAAAFEDPRVPPVTPADFEAMTITVSVLSALEPMEVDSVDGLLAAVQPGRDGLVVRARHRGATLLPSVWEQLGEPAAFVDALWQKAGLLSRSWPPGTVVWRYATEEFDDPGPRSLVAATR